jgi:molecular chaperone HtpG
LDLLTGHTLYNDTDVIIRELAQNSLDAIRLQAEIEGVAEGSYGQITIAWDSSAQLLEITDNGTGMTQSVIESHLLKVGSSRYQDQKFKDKYPKFSSISRFGIGVLSAFMVADSVEITTCSVDDEKARSILLTSVHGKYLIKLLDKISDRDLIGVYPHGTRVRLKLRPTAKIGDVVEVTRKWFLFPSCSIYVTVDNGASVRIGYASPKEAIQSYLDATPLYSGARRQTRVEQISESGVTLAYAVVFDRLFTDYSFVGLGDRPTFDRRRLFVLRG